MAEGNKENKTNIIDSLMNHSKKFMIGVIVFSLVVSFAMIATAWFTSGNGVVATYGEKKVLKTEYDDAKTKCDAFYQYNKDEIGKKNCAQTEIEDQIFRKALETEAEARGITVTEAEVNKRYTDMADAYGGEEAYRISLKGTYNWTPEYVKDNFKRDILQEKLEPYLIASRDGYGVFVRWDWFTGEPSQEQRKANQAPSQELLEKNLYPLMQGGASKEVLKAEVARLRTLGSPWDKEFNIGIIPFKGLNSKTGDSVGLEDWESISKLQKPGDLTGVIKSSMGQFAVYRLESKTDGSFNGWEEFRKDTVNKAKIRSVSYHYDNIKKVTSQRMRGYLKQAKQTLKIDTANATSCADYNFSEFYAYIRDGSNQSLPISGASVIATNNAPARTDLICDQEKSSYTVTSGADGGFTIGQRGRYDQVGAPKSTAPWMLSCWHGWFIDIKKAGYENIQYNADTAPNGSRSRLDSIQGWEWYHGPGGFYKTYNEDGNSYIFMKPVPPPTCDGLTVKKDSSTGAVLADGASVVEGTTTCSGWHTTNATSVTYQAFQNGSSSPYYRNTAAAVDNEWTACSPKGLIGGATTTYQLGVTAYNAAGATSVCIRNLTVTPKPVNGVCKTPPNGGTFSTAPTGTLCKTGTATKVTGSGPWKWTCKGSNGGTNASCSAKKTTVNSYDLRVLKVGIGTGNVKSTSTGINCGTDCKETYTKGTKVTLIAAENKGSTWKGWSGCKVVSGKDNKTCEVVMERSKIVKANFGYTPPPIDVNIKADPMSIIKGKTTTVTGTPSGNPDWCTRTSTSTASKASITTSWNGTDEPGTTVSKVDKPDKDTTYKILCGKTDAITGAVITAEAKVLVKVTVIPALTCSISFNPNPAIQLFPTVISWSTNGDSADITGPGLTGTLHKGDSPKTVRLRDVGPQVYNMTVKRNVDGATRSCPATLTVNPNTDSTGGTQAP